jgi:hypothetical protein
VRTYGLSQRWLFALAGVSLSAALTIVAVLRDRERPARTAAEAASPDVEKARSEVLPFRQSGLIFHWADDAPSVYVRRAMRGALPRDARRDLCRSIAVAKNHQRVALFDESLVVRLGDCTASEGFQPLRD